MKPQEAAMLRAQETSWKTYAESMGDSAVGSTSQDTANDVTRGILNATDPPLKVPPTALQADGTNSSRNTSALRLERVSHCPMCGEKIVQKGRQKQKYCSLACKQAAYRRQKNKAVLPDVQVLAQNIDTLYLNVRYADESGNLCPRPLDDDLIGELVSYKEQALEQKAPVLTEWSYQENPLKMSEKSHKHWSWLVECDYFEMELDAGKMTSIVARVRLSAAYLWQGCYLHALRELECFLYDFLGGMVHLQVSDLHLATDVAGLALDQRNWQKVIICRGRRHKPKPADAISLTSAEDVEYYGSRLETLTYGKHGSQISGQIYNKCIEVKKSGKEFMYPIWTRAGWDGKTVVWRVELRLKRRVLDEFDIDDPYEMFDKLASLWSRLVGTPGTREGWLRMVEPNERDTTRSRWQTASCWLSLQSWRLHEADEGNLVEVQRQRKREKDIRRAYAAIIGYSTTLAAQLVEQGRLQEMDDFSVVLSDLMAQSNAIFTRKQTDYHAELRRKMQRYGIPLEQVPIVQGAQEKREAHTRMDPSIRRRLEEQYAFEQVHPELRRNA